MKKCGKCQTHKENEEFSESQLKRSGGICRSCNKIAAREYRAKNPDKIKKYNQEYGKQYYQENKEKILSGKQEYYQENKIEILQDRKEYYEDNKDIKQQYHKKYYQENREDCIKHASQYYQNNKRKVNAYNNQYNKNRKKINPTFSIRASISSSINIYLKSKGSSKNHNSISKYLPYTIQELKEHLEKQFEPWMNWTNYGQYKKISWNDNDQTTWTWQLDHIIPQSRFNYLSMADVEFQHCWALNNLRPYSSKQNLLDKNRPDAL